MNGIAQEQHQPWPADSERRGAPADRLEELERRVNFHGMHQEVIATQIAELTVAMRDLERRVPELVAQGIVTGIQTAVANKDLMHSLWGSAAEQLMEYGTHATGRTVVGWFKAATLKLLPIGLLLALAYLLGGKVLLVRAAQWFITP